MNDKEFKFTYNRVIEFQMFLLALSSNEFISFLESNNYNYDKAVVKQIDDLKKNLTQYMQWELNYFYNMEEFNIYSLGTMIYSWFLINNPDIPNVEKLINMIENTSNEDVMKIIFNSHYYFMNKTPKEKINLSENTLNENELINIISKANLKSPQVKQKIIECLESPDETKQRYCLLLKQIYDKVYQNIEDDIEIKVKKKLKYYEGIYKEDPLKFTKDQFKSEYEVFSEKVKIHISYFWNINFWYWPKLKGEELVILGINSNQIYNNINPKEFIYNFLKTISDKTRLEIIELLSERKWFVNELAERINVSTATISYHLSRLQDLNIVDYKREDQRFYYFIIKDNLKRYFEEATKILIKE